jgi:hypothetical protein
MEKTTSLDRFTSCAQGKLINLLEKWIEYLIPSANKALFLMGLVRKLLSTVATISEINSRVFVFLSLEALLCSSLNLETY